MYYADKHITSCKRKKDKIKQQKEINEKRKRKHEKGSLFGYFSKKQKGDDISLNASQVEDVFCGRQVKDDISSHKIEVENNKDLRDLLFQRIVILLLLKGRNVKDTLTIQGTIFENFPFQHLKHETFVMENGTLHDKKCYKNDYQILDAEPLTCDVNICCSNLSLSSKIVNIVE